MTYEQAQRLRADLIHLKGRSWKDFTISDVVITPIDPEGRGIWEAVFIENKDQMMANLMAKDSELKMGRDSEFQLECLCSKSNYGRVVYDLTNIVDVAKDLKIEVDLDKYGL